MSMELPEGGEVAAVAAAEGAPPPAGADRYSLTLDCAHKLGQAVLGLLFNPLALEKATGDASKAAVVPPAAAHAAGIPNKAGRKTKRRFRSPSPTAAASLGPADHQQEQQQQASKHKKHKNATV